MLCDDPRELGGLTPRDLSSIENDLRRYEWGLFIKNELVGVTWRGQKRKPLNCHLVFLRACKSIKPWRRSEFNLFAFNKPEDSLNAPLVNHEANDVEGLNFVVVKLIFSFSHSFESFLGECPWTGSYPKSEIGNGRGFEEEESALDVTHYSSQRVLATHKKLL